MLLDKLLADINTSYPEISCKSSNVHAFDSDNKIIYFKSSNNESLTIVSILHELGHYLVHEQQSVNYQVTTPTEMKSKIIETEIMAWHLGRQLLEDFNLNTPDLIKLYINTQAKCLNSYLKAFDCSKSIKQIYRDYEI